MKRNEIHKPHKYSTKSQRNFSITSESDKNTLDNVDIVVNYPILSHKSLAFTSISSGLVLVLVCILGNDNSS